MAHITPGDNSLQRLLIDAFCVGVYGEDYDADEEAIDKILNKSAMMDEKDAEVYISLELCRLNPIRPKTDDISQVAAEQIGNWLFGSTPTSHKVDKVESLSTLFSRYARSLTPMSKKAVEDFIDSLIEKTTFFQIGVASVRKGSSRSTPNPFG